MTILGTNDIYNVVIWTTESRNSNQLQMAFTTSFVVVSNIFGVVSLNVVLNGLKQITFDVL